MPRRRKVLPTDLSLAELKRLVAVKERMDKLTSRKAKLEKELAKIEKDLTKLLAGVGKPARKKAGRKKVAKKKAVGRPRKKKKAVGRPRKKKPVGRPRKKKPVGRPRKKAARKVAKKTVKKAVRKVAKKKVRKTGKVLASPRRKGKQTLEDVVAGLIKKNGKPLAFQDILATIVKKKLVATKSKNFANVLRRTLSTSKKIKRVGRGVYGTA